MMDMRTDSATRARTPSKEKELRTHTEDHWRAVRLASVAAVVLALVLALSATALAGAPDPEFEYHAEDSGIVIDRYLGEEESVAVPATLDGLPVTAIGDYAFADRQTAEDGYVYSAIRLDIQLVSLPEGVERIGKGAFDSLMALEHVDLPDSVMLMGDEAFHACGLASIRWPAALVQIGAGCFRDCAFTALDIPSTLHAIPADAFAENYALDRVTIPEGIEEIGDGAFGGCANLTEISVAGSVRSIGIAAFAGTNIAQMTLPSGLKEMSAGLFMRCGRLASVTVPSSVRTISQNAFLECPALAQIRFDGTHAQWNAIAISGEGNEDLLGITPTCTDSEQEATLPADIQLRPDSGLSVRERSGMYLLLGCGLAEGQERTMGSLEGSFAYPEGVTTEARRGDGAAAEHGDRAATGDEITFYDRRVLACAVTVVVRGDVLGTGRMSLSQVVRLAAALRGQEPLEGPYLAAGDLDGSGSITISDLVQEVDLLRQ